MRLALVLSVMMLPPSMAFAEPLTKGERDRAMSYLHATRKQFLDAMDGLSEAQWKWKPAADRWSVGEVAEHIAVSEQFILEGAVEKTIQGPRAAADVLEKTKGKDESIQKSVPDRTRRFQAPEPLMPAARFADRAALTAAFKERRDRTIAFVEKTPAELRLYVVKHPALGELDAYQWILLIAAHSERHTRQLLEVKETSGFPAK